ncbi:MAG: hypothetical protein AAFP83_02655, partial [Bacteroidota bacterium]
RDGESTFITRCMRGAFFSLSLSNDLCDRTTFTLMPWGCLCMHMGSFQKSVMENKRITFG